MPEIDVKRKQDRTFKEPIQIYKEKLEELFEENQEIQLQNERLRTENQNLLSQNQELSVQRDNLLRKQQELIVIDSEPEIIVPSGKMRNVKRWILPAAAFVLLILAVFFCVRMVEYEKRFADEHSLRVKMTQAYETATKEGEVLQSELRNAQEAAAESENALASLQSELAKLCEGAYGSASSAFYAEESLAVLYVGQTRTVQLHTPKYVHISAFPSDEEALDAAVIISDISSRTAELEITAHQVGVYTVKVRSQRNYPFFDIMVLVLEE